MTETIQIMESDHLDHFIDTKMLGITVLGLKHIQTDSEKIAFRDVPAFLKGSRATVIFQLDSKRSEDFGDQTIYEPMLAAANLSGHSEGGFPIVQDINNRIGPWVLDEDENTFYLQHTTFPHLTGPQFMDHAPNPLKIDKVYYGIFEPTAMLVAFKQSGFKFVNKPMSKERWDVVEPKGYNRGRNK